MSAASGPTRPRDARAARRRRGRWLFLRALLAAAPACAFFSSAPARGEAECAARGPWVLAVVSTASPRELDVAAVLERLGAELSSRGLELCTRAPEAAPRPALATVKLEPRASAPGVAAKPVVSLDIEVRDAVTAKRVGREIDLSSVPLDGRAVVVALAADELLRASWAELALDRAPPPAIPISPEVRAAIAPSAAERRPSAVAIGLRATSEWWTGGLAFFGGDGLLDVNASDRITVELALGARGAPEVSVRHGGITAQALTARLGARIRLTRPTSSVRFCLGARLGGYGLRMIGDPASNARGASAAGLAVTLEGGPSVLLPLGRHGFAVVAEGGIAGALRGVHARDDGVREVGLAGVAAMASLGLVAGAF